MDGRYCAYLRKSRADEVREKIEDGYDALAHHRSTLLELAARMGVRIERWYSDGIKSGDSIEGRPEMTELLEAVKCGEWDGVLCMEVERLTRGDMVDQGLVGRAFTQSGTLIITPLKVYDPASEADMEYFEFGLFMSRREFNAIKKRLIAGRVASVREGQYISPNPPYGYDKAVIDGKKTLVPNENAKYVQAAFRARADGMTFVEVTHMLDAMGAPTSRGKGSWNQSFVRTMLANEVYAGVIAWRKTKMVMYRENGRTRYHTVPNPEKVVAQGLHEPLVDRETFDHVQSMASAPPVPRKNKTRNHYGRILTCAECGKALVYSRTGNAHAPMLTHLGKREGCQTKGCFVKDMDNAVATALESIAADFEVMSGDGGPADIRRTEFSRAIAEAHAAIEANFDRMERGIISEDDFVRRRGVLEARIAESTAALEALPDEEEAERRAVTLRECIAAIKDPSMDAETKRKVIWGVVDHIEYRNHAPFGKSAIEIEVFLR